jgi:HPt (histidine-containing phosphotransfer) domain-containing protein
MAAGATRDLIDFDHLKLYTSGDVALTCEVLQLFRSQCEQLFDTLRAADNLKTVKEIAHGIKGACRSIGAWDAADAAEGVEIALKGTAEDRQRTVVALGEILRKVWAAALAYEHTAQGRA